MTQPEKVALKIMKILEKEDVSIAMVIVTLCLAWLAGAESDRPFEEIDEAINNAAEATKRYARVAREEIEQ